MNIQNISIISVSASAQPAPSPVLSPPLLESPDLSHITPTTGETVQVSKSLVVSSTDQNFEPVGGIYVGFSSHVSTGRRAEKGVKSPISTGGSGAKPLVRKASVVSVSPINIVHYTVGYMIVHR